MSAYKHYAKVIREELKYCTAFPINRKIAVGDVGFFEDDTSFERQDALSHWKIPFRVRRSEVGTSLRCKTAEAIAIEGKVLAPGAALTLPVEGRIELEFRRKGAVLLDIGRHAVVEIEDKAAVGAEVLALYRAKEWVPDHAVVVEVVEAENVTMLVSGEADARAVLSIDGGAAALGAEVSAATGVEVSGHFIVNSVARGRLTPLFKCQGIVGNFITRLLGGEKFRAQGDVEEPVWGDVDPDA